MAYNPNNPNGQATMANSAPVVIASNQSSVPVTVGNFPSTQPISGSVTLLAGSNVIGSIANTSFAATQSGTWTVGLSAGSNAIGSVTVSNFPATQPISGSVSVSNFPATQPVSGTVAVSSLPSIPAGSNVIGAISNTSFAATQSGTWTVGLSAGTNAIGSITNTAFGISGSLPAGSNAIGSVSVSNFPATQPISGSVSVSNFPATQPISGTVTANAGTGTFAVSAASLPLPTGASTSALQSSIISTLGSPFQAGGSIGNTAFGISGSLPAGTNALGSVSVSNFPATQPVSGTVTANAGTGTFAVSAATLPLPSGAATSALQTTGNNYLATIATNTGAQATDTIATGTISALNGAVSVNAQGAYTVSVLITGTWTQNLVVQGLMADGTTWVSLPIYQITTAIPYVAYPNIGPTSATSPNGNGSYIITGGGYTSIRVFNTAYTSGTANVYLDASLAQQTIFSAQLGTWTMYPEGQYNSTPPVLSNGNTSLMQLDSAANLKVNVASNSSDVYTMGTLGALNATVQTSINSVSSAYALISGTWVGTIQFQGSVDGSTFVPLEAVQGGPTNVYTTAGFTSNGGVRIAFPAAFRFIQAKMTAYTSGTANISLNTSAAPANIEMLQFNAANLNAQVVGNIASGSADSGNGVKISGVYNSTIPAIATGQRSDLQTDTTGSLYINPEGRKATYSASKVFATAAAASDVFTIYGSATKTVRITRIEASGIAAASQENYVLIIKRNATNTGGTSAAVTAVPNDSANAAATATVLNYTANPSALGTAAGQIRGGVLELSTASSTGTAQNAAPWLTWDFGNKAAQCPVLRGTSQGLAINLNATGNAISNFTVAIEWTEE